MKGLGGSPPPNPAVIDLGINTCIHFKGISMHHQPLDSDRDLLIQVNTNLVHLDNDVSEIKTRQLEFERNSAMLTENLNRLSFSVGAVVEGLKDTRETLNAVVAHEKRIDSLETWRSTHEKDCDKARQEVDQDFQKLNQIMDVDRAIWSAHVEIIKHWKWLAAGVATVFGIVGWPVIVQLVKTLFSIT